MYDPERRSTANRIQYHRSTQAHTREKESKQGLSWLCYLVYEYINFTGDYTILEEEQPYVMGELLPDGVDERYDVYLESKQKKMYIHIT